MIEQLKKNQLALTSGIQDIMTLNRDLPQITPDDIPGELPAPKEKVTTANISQKFNEKAMVIIREKGLLDPAELLKLNVDQLEEYAQEVKDKSKKIGYEIASLKRKNHRDLIPAKVQEKETIDAYGETVKDVKNFKNYYTSEEKKEQVSNNQSETHIKFTMESTAG